MDEKTIEQRHTAVLWDTSPLVTLCSFKIGNKPIIEHILPLFYQTFVVVQTVATELTANPTHADSAVANRLLSARVIKTIPIPSPPISSVIDQYTKLGQGKRDTIRLGIMMPRAEIIFDDYLALVVAGRFGLKPILLLDFVVSLAEKGIMSSEFAQEIVQTIRPRYSSPFVEHTLYKLKEIKT